MDVKHEVYPPSQLKYVICCVFSPKGLESLYCSTAESNHSLARAACTAARAYSEMVGFGVLKHQWRCIIEMLDDFQTSIGLRHPNKNHIISRLGEMQIGDSRMFFNETQGAAVMFKTQKHCTLYTSFRAPFSSDPTLVCSYPEWVVEIPNDVYRNHHFQSELANCLLYRMSNSATTDTRLLTCILRGIGRNIESHHFSKHIHCYGADNGHRQTLWLLIRIAILLSLDQDVRGRICYKSFVLHFMCTLGRDAIGANLSDDVLHAISAKILRRLKKLGSSAPDWLSDTVLKTTASLRETMEVRLKKRDITDLSWASPLPWRPSELNLAKDKQLSLLHSREYICSSLANDYLGPLHIPFRSEHVPRGTLSDFLSANFFEEACHLDSYPTLYNVEQAVEDEIDHWITGVENVDQGCVQLGSLMGKYLTKASQAYKDNPEHISIMLLTVVELWIALDKLVIATLPILADSDFSSKPENPTGHLYNPVFRSTTNFHRFRHASRYLSVRDPRFLPGCFLSHSKITRDMLSVRCHVGGFPDTVDSSYFRHHYEKYGSTISSNVDLVIFELQCHISLYIWHSSTAWLVQSLGYSQFAGYKQDDGLDLVFYSISDLQPYLVEYWVSPATDNVYLTCVVPTGHWLWNMPHDISHPEDSPTWSMRHEDLTYCRSSPNLELYANSTAHVSNDVLAAQARCPGHLSACEFTAFGQLRSGGSLQWSNILRELRSKTLNLRRPDVYILLAQATSQAGPLNLATGEYVYHQELQESSFCYALVDELESFICDVAAHSFDGVMTSAVSLLLNRLLASNPCEDVSERVIELLLRVRTKTFEWVREMSYDLTITPGDTERTNLLRDMAATCRSTFDVAPAVFPRVLRSAEDVEALVSCAIFIHVNSPIDPKGVSAYSQLLLERDRRLSLKLEGTLKDVIQADVSDRGIDLAVGNVWSSYRPGPHRWKPSPDPNSRWLMCETAATGGGRHTQIVHFNLFNGALLVDSKPIDALPRDVREQETYKRIFGEKIFLCLASDLSGMDLCTLGVISGYRVHFALRDGNLVIRTQHKDTMDVLELIPPEKLKGDLPATLVNGHVHWLNFTSSTIEIRPLETFLEQSEQNWKIECASGLYCMYKGSEYLMDIRSRTWEMVSSHLECLDVLENLIITTLPAKTQQSVEPVQRLTVVLPRYGLSFFVNENGDLESSDFKDMIYDENQCVGTLFGLESRLVLRPKVQIEEGLIPRCIIIPEGRLLPKQHGHHARISIDTSIGNSLQVPYHAYRVDTDLGSLTGYSNWRSRLHLAHLHACTSIDWKPDQLTGRTGVQEALHLFKSAGCRSMIALDIRQDDVYIKLPSSYDYAKYPQIRFAVEEIEHLIRREKYLTTNQSVFHFDPPKLHELRALRTAHLFPSETTRSIPVSSNPDLSENEDLAYTISLAVFHWLIVTEKRPEPQGDPELARAQFRTPEWVNSCTCQPSVCEVDDLIQRALEAGQQFRLLFLLTRTVFCQLFDFQRPFLSVLISLAKRFSLQDLPRHSEHRPLHGYRPSPEALRKCFDDAKHDPSTHMYIDTFTAIVDQLLTTWPSEAPPVALIPQNPDLYDVEKLNTNLGALFSNCYVNFELKEDLVRPLHESKPDILPSADWPSRDSTHASNSPCHTPGRTTLDQLLSTRSPPTLPDPSRLVRQPSIAGRNTAAAPCDTHTHTLTHLLTSLRIDSVDPRFRQQYISRLHTSVRHAACGARIMTSKTVETSMGPLVEELREYYLRCRDNYLASLDTLKKELGPKDDPLGQALERSGQWPQITPDTLLQCLASTSPVKLPDVWKKCLVSLALLLLRLQRARRLLRFALDNLTEELCSELENEGCEGWSAEAYPDWLLIQIQGDFLIRGNQVDIAFNMISPPRGENTAMQAAIGEGKSSVMLPMTAATLADGSQLVRVIIPKALTTQMFRLLVDRLGGLVNRRIYHLSFSRSLTSGYSKRRFRVMRSLLSECMRDRGVLVIQPEDILSLKLISVERQFTRDFKDLGGANNLDSESNSDADSVASMTYIGESLVRNVPSGHEFLEFQRWSHFYARDILDESDEVLHPGFHLMYTIGLQQHLEGHPDRWTITQHVLGLVRKHALSLSQDLSNAIEYEADSSPGSFPHTRILRFSDAGPRLISLIVDDVMNGYLPCFSFRDIDRRLHASIRAFISSKHLLRQTADTVEKYARQSTLWDGILVLRGLLACDILLFALSERRWRVDYGLFPERTMVAVPYRAKDVPATTAEFGHPDIMIVLTCLAYYYGGLTEEQLRSSFEFLQEQDNPSMEYSKWLHDFPPNSIPECIRNIGSINIKSSEQWDAHLFPLFSRNQGAVDLYLSRVVFPREAKEFPWKIAASNWDLTELRERPITGFSGTNDGQYLLPTSITQLELDHQRGSNASALAHVLRSAHDHNTYALISNTKGERRSTIDVLRMVVDQGPRIRVLLDVGAQILDFSNYQLAKAWLSLSSDSDGAVYFNEDDELTVLTRDGVSRSLPSSPFAQRLDRCVVYLDDAHTRGTDLKFPNGFRAAVTLGPKVTKDRLIQGCMRMRKLGRGHTIMFFAPFEVDRTIRAVTGKDDLNIPIDATDILRWAIHEAWTDIQRRAPYWAQAGINYHSRHDAWTRFCNDELTPEELEDAWLQPEHKSLAGLYAPFQNDTTSDPSVLDDHPEIQQHCVDLGAVSLPEAQIDKEQEREVNREIEHEREVEAPSEATPAKHYLHPDVVAFVQTGIIHPLHPDGAFLPVFAALEGSSAATPQPHIWSPFLLATVDFCKTIVPTSCQGKTDQYLRPVQWVLSGKKDNDRVLVLLSPFEADCLMPDIRISKHVHLHVYTPRTSERMRPTDDLMFYSIPPVPKGWTPPWDLVNQLNVFAGQLYLRDYESYMWLRCFLGLHVTPPPKNVGPLIRRNRITPVELAKVECTPADSILRSVMMLLAVRQKGLPFAETHMGRILQGQHLSRGEFDNVAWTNSGCTPSLWDAQIPNKTGDGALKQGHHPDADAERPHKRLRAGPS